MRATCCIALLGGSFDPVHNAHVALANYFAKLIFPDELRIIPTGNPWQKPPLQATAEQRVEMVRLAFRGFNVPLVIDEQEIRRTGPTYTVETLRQLRETQGPAVSLALLMGADQLVRLHTWKNWQALFDYAHVCVASRPGFDMMHLPPEVAREVARRQATPEQIRTTPHGLVTIATNLHIDIAATEIRRALAHGERVNDLVPSAVLDYIKQHHLYENTP